jgi:transposase-like protein
MSLRKVADQEEATMLLSEAEHSGLPRAVVARRHGIDPRSLNLWRINLQRRDRPPATLRLVELVPDASTSASAGVRVRVGNLIVEVDVTFDASTLGRVLAVVAGC